MVDLLERHGHLALAAETGPRRYQTGAYQGWALHVRTLLTQAGLDHHPALVDALLAPLAPDVFAHQRASGLTPAQIADAWPPWPAGPWPAERRPAGGAGSMPLASILPGSWGPAHPTPGRRGGQRFGPSRIVAFAHGGGHDPGR